MVFAALTESHVVPRSDGIDHIEVHIVVCSKGEATLDDTLGVVPAVCGVVVVVAGQDVLLDVGNKFGIHACKSILRTYNIHPMVATYLLGR